ncbi:hypothetical protein NEUTE2DRAFT_127701 [Neurospora tetrasperma FGSC 2509]|nr:hypothetical protein NEUTE2DRAFT_127701 [Neurospora tetrasperma FGSC 2509]
MMILPPNLSHECPEHGTDPDRLHVATAVHKDCFVIAKQSCPLAPRLTCERIWELAVARNPWPHGFRPPKSLSLESPYFMSPQAVNQVASIVSIPQLKNFPSELVERIRLYSPGNTPFWRAVAALTVASSLPNIPIFAEQRVKIRHILHWKRGEQIATVGPRGQDDRSNGFASNRRFAYVLLGTKRDELALDKRYGECSRRLAYCRNGLLRLAFDADDIYHDNEHGVRIPFLPRIWNTPTPPDLTNCIYLYHGDIFKDFATGYYISLDSISGLTFVYRGKELVAIHPHRGDDVEMNCPKVLSSGSSKIQEACFFLPVSKEDAILRIGVGIYKNAFVVVVKKRLSGDSVIGLPCHDPPRDDPTSEGPDEDEFYKDELWWGQRDPIALVYGIPGKRNFLSMLGGYRGTPPAKPKWEGWEGIIPHIWHSNLFRLDDDEDLRFYTRAPLRGVVAAQMFYYPSRRNRPTGRVCSGIIFHYDNGGSRVVGEIRLENRAKLAGETIINPKLICLERDILPGFHTPNIHFVTESEIESGAHPNDSSWNFDECPRCPGRAFTYHPMRGTINWWFTARQRNSIGIYECIED